LINNYMNLYNTLYNYLLNCPTILEAISDIGDKEAEEKGAATEKAFAKMLSRTFGRGYYIEKSRHRELEDAYKNFLEGNADWFQATNDQETLDHFDFGIRENNKITRIEVKGNKDKIISMALSKKLRIKNADPGKGLFIELQGVTGRPGWVWGKADYVAFQNKDESSFTAWTLPAIRQLVVKKDLNNAPIATKIEDAVYARYQRPTKRDFVTIISTDEIKTFGGHKVIFR